MRVCSVCEHPQGREINLSLLAGTRSHVVAQRFGLDDSTMNRHKRLHLQSRANLTEAEAAAPARLQAIENHEVHLDVMRAMRDLHRRTLALLDKAEASNDLHIALRAVREARGNLELLGRLDGSLDGPVAPTSGNVIVQVQYIDKAIVQHSPAPSALPPAD
jgi:hypothetical protein